MSLSQIPAQRIGEALPMQALVRSIFSLLVDLFRPRVALEAELLVLRQQIIVLRRGRSSRPAFRTTDKLLLGWLCQLFPNVRNAVHGEFVNSRKNGSARGVCEFMSTSCYRLCR
jgi:hypothetical protein